MSVLSRKLSIDRNSELGNTRDFRSTRRYVTILVIDENIGDILDSMSICIRFM